jgi:L-ribulose-5-phosphate 4-epimerase
MPSAVSSELRDEVWRSNLRLVSAGLVTLSFGNASGIDRVLGIVLIKPSGVAYDELTQEQLVAVSLEDGRLVSGDLRPSSDLPTHLALYRAYPMIAGIVHTHSIEATAWAQAGRSIPPFGTTHADHFNGPVPVSRQLTRAEIDGQYEVETGRVIIETIESTRLDPLSMPAVLVASHGPFTWGPSAAAAVESAIALEAVAAMATRTVALDPGARPIADALLERHHRRKHGADAYYGQVRR